MSPAGPTTMIGNEGPICSPSPMQRSKVGNYNVHPDFSRGSAPWNGCATGAPRAGLLNCQNFCYSGICVEAQHLARPLTEKGFLPRHFFHAQYPAEALDKNIAT